jgi:nucleoid-associated protein YgaU
MVEPEISDLQLTVDTLKASARDSQRTIMDLRAEADTRRQELADAQVARAQFEGRIREAERRLAEARHIVELQREELAASRAERDRVARASILLQNQLKQLQRQLSKLGGKVEHEERRSAAPTHYSIPNVRPLGRVSAAREEGVPTDQKLNAMMTTLPNETASVGRARAASSPVPAWVSVKPGDTLWSISRRYRVGVNRLRVINQLADDRIEIGQALWLSVPPGTQAVTPVRPE